MDQKVFVAVEVPPPSTPICPNGPRPMDTNINIGGSAVRDTVRATPGTGVASGSQNYDPMLQQWSFLRSSAGAHTTRYPVQQTHETVRKEEVAAANVARSEEANLGRNVMECVRRHGRSGSSMGSSVSAAKTIPKEGAATKEKEAAKRRCINDDKKVAWQSTSSGPNGDSDLQMHQAKESLVLQRERWDQKDTKCLLVILTLNLLVMLRSALVKCSSSWMSEAY